jgi:hypothetical protein
MPPEAAAEDGRRAGARPLIRRKARGRGAGRGLRENEES